MKNTEITTKSSSENDIQIAVKQWFEIVLNAIDFIVTQNTIKSQSEDTATLDSSQLVN